jgi:hypothetical protein
MHRILFKDVHDGNYFDPSLLISKEDISLLDRIEPGRVDNS